MNPYEANVRNVSARLGAWMRGMVRLYRRPLMVLLLAGVTTAVGVSAGEARDGATLAEAVPAGQVMSLVSR